jgi:hypothetical protein
MSRTYRRSQVEIDCNCGAPYEEPSKWWPRDHHFYIRAGLAPARTCECGQKYDYYTKRNFKRDGEKPYWKCRRYDRKLENRRLRAKTRDLISHEKYDDIPKKAVHFRW